ncbi:type II toxin-antitoxin system RelE/ParE family toxin [Thiomicrospira sp. R3]|uniref:type II toxin-antitoxin system RelE/ParE family toxin n=1 Tax=Thiomicrospira sp. R3 TaxID=3035472 RepID=UPI00259B6D33|nr:type II toxin-antitoxin system RelE/ParE family toxin [Thiomicrospira sp. R3]WFE68108.1 type II toxin-antitoxin system RelE/ParE family toxin [Thiomicrospira sp. R3]
MADVIWAETALAELDAVADYIALDNPSAAKNLVQTVFSKTRLLADFLEIGSAPNELADLDYRQLIISPCRIFYRISSDLEQVYIVHILRQEHEMCRFFR